MGVGSCRLTYFAAEMQKLANELIVIRRQVYVRLKGSVFAIALQRPLHSQILACHPPALPLKYRDVHDNSQDSSPLHNHRLMAAAPLV
jgi:hypothetical protein